MGLRLQLCLALFAMLSLATYGQELRAEAGDFQAIQKGETEFEDGEEMDLKFDAEILEEEGRPEEKPDQEKVEAVFKESRDVILKEADAQGESEAVRAELPEVGVTLYSEYLARAFWYPLNSKRCCPATQNYGCGTNYYRQPCFYHWVGGRREWCCPFWGNTLIRNCNCSKCFSLRKDCIYEGRCLRRYTKRTFYAVCYNSWWGIIRRFTRWLPTSCYCRLNRYQPFCSLSASNTLTKG